MNPLTIAFLTFLAVLGAAGAFAVFACAVSGIAPDEEIIDTTDDPRWKSKDDVECCKAKALPDGRPVIGFCGPDCERRPK